MIDCPPAEVRVIDGDTLECRGESWRIVGLDAPEIHGACPAERARAQAAKGELAGEVQRCGAVLDPLPRRDRYGRGLARVTVCGQDVADWLIGLRLARPYDGDRRRPWCTPVPRPRPSP